MSGAGDGDEPAQADALAGLRILELGQLIAGPFATALLASWGAEVIKVEPPGVGDPIRRWRKLAEDGTSLWWRTIGRNKKSVVLDLRRPAGQDVVRRLVAESHVDVLVENFRPGRMESWGLGWEALRALNPRLIMVRVSGWGQDGPRAGQPGFANIAEAYGGMRALSGEPDRPPVRAGISIGDSLAGLHAALGLMTAVYRRDVVGTGTGQLVDVALYESVFNVLESVLPEYDRLGHVRRRAGSKLEGIVPTGTYACEGDEWVVIGANSDGMFERLMRAMGRDDLAEDPRLRHNDGRVEHERLIDDAIEAYTSSRTLDDVLAALERAGVASGPILDIAQIVEEPHFKARRMFETATLPDGSALRVPAAVPRLSETPGRTRWAGPEHGAHEAEVLGQRLGLSDAEIRAARGEVVDAGDG
jgi:formyl-CoA transferase